MKSCGTIKELTNTKVPGANPVFITECGKIKNAGISVHLATGTFITVVTGTHLVFYKPVVTGGKKYIEVRRIPFNVATRIVKSDNRQFTQFSINSSIWSDNTRVITDAIEREMCAYSIGLLLLLGGDGAIVVKDTVFSAIYYTILQGIAAHIKNNIDNNTPIVDRDTVMYSNGVILRYPVDSIPIILLDAGDTSDESDFTKWGEFLEKMGVPYHILKQVIEHPDQKNEIDTIVIGVSDPTARLHTDTYNKWYTNPDEGFPSLEIKFLNGKLDGFNPDRFGAKQ